MSRQQRPNLRSRRYGTIKPKNYLSRFQGPSKADSAYRHFWTVDRTEQSLRISYWRRRSIELLEIKGNNKFSRLGISGRRTENRGVQKSCRRAVLATGLTYSAPYLGRLGGSGSIFLSFEHRRHSNFHYARNQCA